MLLCKYLLQHADMDEDVYEEEKRVRSGDIPESTAVKITNLNKTYSATRKGGDMNSFL